MARADQVKISMDAVAVGQVFEDGGGQAARGARVLQAVTQYHRLLPKIKTFNSFSAKIIPSQNIAALQSSPATCGYTPISNTLSSVEHALFEYMTPRTPSLMPLPPV